MLSATPKAETDGLGRVIEGASPRDLYEVGRLIRDANQRWGDDAPRRLELLAALMLRARINRE